MSKPPNGDRLRHLEDRIAALKGKDAPKKSHQDQHYSQAQLAWRMVIELVAGMGIGVVIGIGLDALFGTKPAMLILFALLGFVAGVKTMLRSADEMKAKRRAEAQEAEQDEAP